MNELDPGIPDYLRPLLRQEPEYTISPARYAKGMLAVSCPSPNGYKTRAARLCEHLKGRYSNREGSYILSPSKVVRFQMLFDTGRDASSFTGKLYDH